MSAPAFPRECPASLRQILLPCHVAKIFSPVVPAVMVAVCDLIPGRTRAMPCGSDEPVNVAVLTVTDGPDIPRLVDIGIKDARLERNTVVGIVPLVAADSTLVRNLVVGMILNFAPKLSHT